MTAAVVISTAPDGTDDWHATRRTGIGGSDAAAICGLSKYATPYTVWLEKTGPAQPDTAGEAARWGTLLEPVVRDEVARLENLDIADAAGTYAHPDRPWQHANVDGLIAPAGIYEGKTANLRLADEWADDRVPDRYLLQGMHYLSVLGPEYDHLLYGCLIGGQELVIRRVERDQEAIDALVAIETRFWAHVESGEPPPVDGSDATAEALKNQWLPDAQTAVTVDRVTVDELIAQRAAAVDAEAAAKADRQAAENQLKALLGEATDAVDVDGNVLYTWRKNKDGTRLDTKALEAAYPDIVAAHTVPKPGHRVLRITTTNKGTPK